MGARALRARALRREAVVRAVRRARRRGVAIAIVAAVLLSVAGAVGDSSASSARRHPPSRHLLGGGSCSTGSTTFSSTGAEQCYTVPTGVSTLYVTVHGAPGGSTSSSTGGKGAVATGHLSVTAGDTLYVEVGGSGAAPGSAGKAFDGGGAAAPGSGNSTTAGGGGGASDIRTTSCASSCTTGGDSTSLGSRLIVAGGGGGAGANGSGSDTGGAGGDAGNSSGDGSAGGNGTGGNGGNGGTSSAGGTGGTGSASIMNGLDGSLGGGGGGGPSGLNASAYGGGGGGGYYGGGGGGGVQSGTTSAGGGAGGSSTGPSGTTYSSASGTAYVTISTTSSGAVATTTSATSITKSSATLNGTVDTNGASTSYHFEWGTTTAYGTSTSTQSLSAGGVDSVSASISGLSAGTTYHFRLVAGSSDGADATFTTPAPPTVTTGGASASDTSSTVSGTIDPNGETTTYHVDYGTTASYGSSTSDVTLPTTSSTQTVAVSLTGLAASRTYHYRLVASSAGGTTDGGDATFTTTTPPPVVTLAATTIASTSATVNGTVDDQGRTSTYHFDYGTTAAYGDVSATATLPAFTGTQSVSANLTGLRPDTVYHVRVVADNTNGTGDGNDVTFTTSSGLPTVTTGAPTNLASPLAGAGSAQFGGTIDPQGSAATYHFEYHPTSSATVESTPDRTLAAGTGSQSVSATATDLVPDVRYVVTLVASNAQGSATGGEQSFFMPERAPSVQTCCGVDVTRTSVTLRGFVLTPGAGTYHFDYGLTRAYGRSTPEQRYIGTTSPIVLEAHVTGLSAGAEYHFRLVAANDGGATDGADTIFGTAIGSTVTPPEVVSVTPQLTASGVVLHARVNTRGRAGVANFEYGTPSLDTQTAETTLAASSDDQALQATIDGSALDADQTYGFQAVVTTAGGTVALYGTFTTPAVAPDVRNEFVTGVGSSNTTSSATVQCLVNPHGTATAVTVAYTATAAASPTVSPADDYGVRHTTPAVDLAAGIRKNVTPVFQLTGLDAGTSYTYSCQAANAAGSPVATPAGSFTTPKLTLPTVSTQGFHVDPGETSATLSALVDPGGKNTDYFFQYGRTSAYGDQVDSTDQVAGSAGPTAVTLDAAHLVPDTTYHYRAGVKHADGTVVYGADDVFITGKPQGLLDVRAVGATGATLGIELDNRGLEQNAAYRVDAVTQAQYAATGFDQAFQSGTTTTFAAVPADEPSSNAVLTLHNLQPGTTYIAVVRFSQQVGSGAKNWTQTSVVSFATGGFISTEPPTTITTSSATLNGIASGPGPYRFVYYSLDDPATRHTVATAESFPDATELDHEDYSAAVTGLRSGTRYVFGLVGSDRRGTEIAFDTAGGKCPGGSALVSGQGIPKTQFTVSGCWQHATADGNLPTGTSTYVGVGTQTINGIQFTPATDAGTLTINTSTDILSSSEGETIALGTTTLYSATQGALSVAFDGGDSHFILAKDQVSTDAAVFGLPIAGAIVVAPGSDGGATATTTVGLPAIFGADAGLQSILKVDPDGTVEDPEVDAATVSDIGPIQLPSLSLKHSNGTQWDGEATLRLPGVQGKDLGKNDKSIDASIQITGNRLTGFGVSVDGVEIPLGASGAVITSIGAELGDNPFHLKGNLGLDVGPKIGENAALEIEASLYLAINSQEQLPQGIPGVTAGKQIQSPFTLKVHGDASLLGVFPVANADVVYYGLAQPFVAFNAGINADLSVGDCPGQSDRAFGVTAKGTLAGAFQGPDFNLEGDLGVKLRFLCATIFGAEADSAISSDGIGFCGSLATAAGTLSVGAGEKWGSAAQGLSTDSIGKNLTIYGGTADNGPCSISTYEHAFSLSALRHARAIAGADALPDLRFPAGKRFAVVKFVGKGGPPLVQIAGPGGRSVSTQAGKPTVDTASGMLVLPDPRTNVTTVSIARPGTGAYHVTLEPGSPAVADVQDAMGLPASNVQARVTGTGRIRTLVWHAARIAGQTLRFEEVGANGEHTILRTAKTAGRLAFRPADGIVGRRSLVAVVFEHGAQRSIVHLGTFTGPTPVRPSAVRGLRIARRAGHVQVTWTAEGPRPSSYEVVLTTTAGQRLVLRPTGTHATFPALDRGFSAAVSVRGVSPALLLGPVRRATLASGPHLVVAAPSLAARGGRDVLVPVACRGGGCRAVLTLAVAGKHRTVRIAVRAVELAAGRSSTVALRLTPAGRKALAQTNASLAATLTASVAGGATVTRLVRVARG